MTFTTETIRLIFVIRYCRAGGAATFLVISHCTANTLILLICTTFVIHFTGQHSLNSMNYITVYAIQIPIWSMRELNATFRFFFKTFEQMCFPSNGYLHTTSIHRHQQIRCMLDVCVYLCLWLWCVYNYN